MGFFGFPPLSPSRRGFVALWYVGWSTRERTWWSVAGDRALLSRGLERGVEVVTDGAAELFGTEFGTPH